MSPRSGCGFPSPTAARSRLCARGRWCWDRCRQVRCRRRSRRRRWRRPPRRRRPQARPLRPGGGGYSGPLVYRQGEGMRPDVAAAFDAMAAAAARVGLTLVVTSGFRSDAEQAALFAANPDPRWVAPPGRSLHRCATELDLGPADAYAWLAAERRSLRFRQALRLGALALRLTRMARRRARRPAIRSPEPAPTAPRPASGCRASSRPASGDTCCARRDGGTSRRPCSQPS